MALIRQLEAKEPIFLAPEPFFALLENDPDGFSIVLTPLAPAGSQHWRVLQRCTPFRIAEPPAVSQSLPKLPKRS